MTPRDALLRHYRAAADTLAPVLADLPNAQLHWSPHPEARSIAEITRHLIRVDGWFLQQFGLPEAPGDPGEQADAAALSGRLAAVRDAVSAIIGNPTTDLSQRPNDPDGPLQRAFAEVVMHMAHHYLYHLAQMIYLRRAQDRTWKAPLARWEAATYAQGADLAPIQSLLNGLPQTDG